MFAIRAPSTERISIREIVNSGATCLLRDVSPRRVTLFWEQRGATMVEAMLGMTLFLLLTMGVLDFGLVIYRKTVLDQAARNGVHAGKVKSTASCSSRETVAVQATRTRLQNFSFVDLPSVLISASTDPAKELLTVQASASTSCFFICHLLVINLVVNATGRYEYVPCT